MARRTTWIDVDELEATLLERKNVLGIKRILQKHAQCVDVEHNDGSKKRWFNPGERKVLFTPEPKFVM